MGQDKRTIMVLKVDLQCSCCYKKVKKVLCKFPHQVYDEKANTVTIVVVCCSPEKIRDKICCKGGKTIKSIEIKDSSKPKEPEKPKVPEKLKVVEKPKEPEKPKVVEKPKQPEKPKEPEKPKVTFVEPEKPKSNGGGDKPKSDEKPPKADPPPKQLEPAPKPSNPAPEPGIIKMPDPVNGYPPLGYPPAFPVDTCCGQCYNGFGGGPCYQGHGFGRPVPPPPGPVDTCCGQCYNGFGGGPCYQGHGFGRPVPPPPGPCYDGYGYGGNRGCYVSREYFSEENPAGCSIM